MNFIEDYKILTSNNEAPEIYHRWSAIAVLSGAVSRQVWIDQGIFTIYPNLYLILVGEPGNGKSTAMSIAKKLVRALGRPLAPSAITKEALCQQMGNKKSGCHYTFKVDDEERECTHMSVFANELVTFLGADQMGMIDMLTDIWDEEVYENKTKNKGHDIIQSPFLSLLCCMTPEITDNLVRGNIIKGGFARRCIFICSNHRVKAVPFPQLHPEHLEARKRCVERLAQIKDIQGCMDWSTNAREWFIVWYEAKFKAMQGAMNVAKKGYYRSKDVLLIKLGLLISLAEDDELVLRTRHLVIADEMLAETERSLDDVFSGSGRNVEADIAKKVLEFVVVQKRATEKLLRAHMFEHANTQETTNAIQHLVDTGKIVKDVVINSGGTTTHFVLGDDASDASLE